MCVLCACFRSLGFAQALALRIMCITTRGWDAADDMLLLLLMLLLPPGDRGIEQERESENAKPPYARTQQ